MVVGTFVPVRSYNVTLKGESGRDEIFFPWPTQILHLVDEDSPLWSLSRDELLEGRYELIVVIDCVSGTTSRPFQARKSYHTCEIKWGHRFANLKLSYGCSGSYLMNLCNFHNTVPTSTPLCSAQDITHLREMYQASHPETAQEPKELKDNSASSDIVVYPETGLDSDGSDHPSRTSSKKAPRCQRSKSVEVTISPPDKPRQRRCSLGDMIRVAQGEQVAKKSVYADALNIYRHRRSVTDTYLGAEIDEEADEVYHSDQAVLTIVSQRSAEIRTDVRDILPKRRRNSVQIFFGKETGSSWDVEDGYDRDQAVLSVRSQRGVERRTDVRDIFARRKSYVQLHFAPEPTTLVGSEIVIETEEKDALLDAGEK